MIKQLRAGGLGFKSSRLYSRACSEPLHCTVFSGVTYIQFVPQGFCAGMGGVRGEIRQEEGDGLGWAGQLELSMVLVRGAWSWRACRRWCRGRQLGELTQRRSLH